MDIFEVLSVPTRKKIIELLAEKGKLTANDIYKNFHSTSSAVSQHLKVLRNSSLVKVERKGQKRIYEINPQKIIELEKWASNMRTLWNERFDALDKVLEEEKQKQLIQKGGEGRWRTKIKLQKG